MLDAYSVDDIVISQHGSYDEWNEPVSGSEVEVRGYVEWKTRLTININGEQVVSTIQIYIKKRILDDLLLRPLTHEDSVKSINGADINRAIITVHQPKAFSSPHYEVYLA
jgi:hypothetical protein